VRYQHKRLLFDARLETSQLGYVGDVHGLKIDGFQARRLGFPGESLCCKTTYVIVLAPSKQLGAAYSVFVGHYIPISWPMPRPI
jgi:hypothetical protein